MSVYKGQIVVPLVSVLPRWELNNLLLPTVEIHLNPSITFLVIMNKHLMSNASTRPKT